MVNSNGHTDKSPEAPEMPTPPIPAQGQNPPPPPAQVEDTSLLDTYTLTFTKRQWIIIFNTLVKPEYPLGAARIILPIVDQIEPVVAASSDKDVKPVSQPKVGEQPKEEGKPVIK